MTSKKRIIQRVHDETGISRHQVEKVLNAFIKAFAVELLENERVELRRFGVWRTESLPSTTVTNPKTQQPVQLPERTRVRTKISATIEKLLNPESN